MSKKILDEHFYQVKWKHEQIYSYNSKEKKEKTFVIDTPPPTISGALHIGHVFSYTQTDILARFQRMKGKNVFYPMGWDNNGLPTERRVQNLYKITCDPVLSDTNSVSVQKLLNRKGEKKITGFLPVSRNTFVSVCSRQTREDQKKYEQLWRQLGLSVDWNQTYETISPHSQIISQRSFLDLYKKGLVENRHTPVFWDTQFKTAVAQADIEDRKREGFYHKIKFQMQDGGGEFVISTTRPELLPACVAIAAHPDDERYKKFFNKLALTPLFSVSVPVIPSTHADPEKGTGILMICTFGDMDDVRFWEKQKLPLRQIINPDGFLKDIVFGSTEGFPSSEAGQADQYYSELKGLRVHQARKKIMEILAEKKLLTSPPQPTEQFVKFYEKGGFPLELMPTRQWYIKILKYKSELLEQGKKIKWHPPAMLKRYEQWVNGLNQDWCISRQRFFGVPFPVWYPLNENKIPDYGNPVLPYSAVFSQPNPSKNIDPLSSAPADWDPSLKNYTENQRGKSFIADTSVMDTWATSSLTPQISSYWGKDVERHKRLFPADLRPQAHEIIRTWAFYTIVKSFFHETGQNIPWKNIAISGWVMNPERLKMSKSKKGSAVVSPEKLIEKYSADAIRYWAGKARLGMDTVYDENMFKTGKKLVIKLNNAFRFVQIQIQGMSLFFSKENVKNNKSFQNKFPGFEQSLSHISTVMDQAWITYLLDVHKQATSCLETFNYSQALDLIEKSFWLFCDNYLELVKGRAYQFTHFKEMFLSDETHTAGETGEMSETGETGENKDRQKNELCQNARSAVCSLDLSMYMFIKMLAPYMPYITEHIWSQRYIIEKKSVHISSWDLSVPSSFDLKENTFKLLKFCFNLLEQIRSQKALQQKSLSSPVKELKIKISEEEKTAFDFCREDIIHAAHIKTGNIIVENLKKSENPQVSVVLENE